MLAVGDLVAILVTAGALALWDGDGVAAVLLFAPGWIVTAKLVGLYDLDHRRLRHLTTDEFTRIVVYVLLGSVALTAVLLLLPGEGGALDDAAHMRLGLILVATTVAFRVLARRAPAAARPARRHRPRDRGDAEPGRGAAVDPRQGGARAGGEAERRPADARHVRDGGRPVPRRGRR